jgi:hypothetical protein
MSLTLLVGLSRSIVSPLATKHDTLSNETGRTPVPNKFERLMASVLIRANLEYSQGMDRHFFIAIAIVMKFASFLPEYR